MNEAIAHLKHAVKSLQKLEEIFGPSKRTAAGVLEDLSEWLANETPGSHVYAAESLDMNPDSFSYIKKAKSNYFKWHNNARSENFDYALKSTSDFARNDLEGCILGLQAAIQILEEEQNNE